MDAGGTGQVPSQDLKLTAPLGAGRAEPGAGPEHARRRDVGPAGLVLAAAASLRRSRMRPRAAAPASAGATAAEAAAEAAATAAPPAPDLD